MWAWFDALFMGSLFAGPKSSLLHAEFGAMLTFLASSVVAFFVFRTAGELGRRVGGNGVIGACSALGAIGSVALLVSGLVEAIPSAVTLVVGSVLCGCFMAVGCLGWGAVYSRRGSVSAMTDVSGAFAFAVILDGVIFSMDPYAQAAFYAVMPAISGVVLATLPQGVRQFARAAGERCRDAEDAVEPAGVPGAADVAADADVYAAARPRSGLRGLVGRYLGVCLDIFVGLMLIMVAFGYLQHIFSFSSVASGGATYGVPIQMIRGVGAVVMFLVIVLAPRRATLVWTVGLLLMAAGFMVMPFVFGTGGFLAAGALVILGYTAFDILMWVVFSQEGRTQSEDQLRTIALYRMAVGVCYCLGAAVGLELDRPSAMAGDYLSQITTAVGYLVVIAIVLLMKSDDMHSLFRGGMSLAGPLAAPAAGADAQTRRPNDGVLSGVPGVAVGSGASVLGERLDAMGLTPREREIALLMLQGRTQPWVASHLCISENTVGTHMRHIYQKAGVHNRQQFIDLLT